MNDMSTPTLTQWKVYEDPAFVPAKEVVRATKQTFGRNGQALFGNIAYLDSGAKLYQNFIEASGHTDQTDSQRLIAKHGGTIAQDIGDIQRLIAIGGGSYNSFYNQELALVREMIKHSPESFRLNEFVLIDVSEDFLLEQQQALAKFSQDNNININVISIRSDFERISGERFDSILMDEFNGAKSRNEVKAAVISTGATFGNLTNPSITNALPTHDIEVRMAKMGDFISVGSVAIFDYFTKTENAENYYNQAELAEFFENIPHIIRCYGRDALENFYENTPGTEDGVYFRYKAKAFYDSRLIAHQLVAVRPQESVIHNGGGSQVLTIGPNEKYTMMYSARPRTDDIQSRPSRNTGLRPDYHVSSGDLVTHVATKICEAEVLKSDDDEPQVATNPITQVARGQSILGRARDVMSLSRFLPTHG